MGEDRARRRRSAAWRVRAFAVAAVALLHAGALGVLIHDWAKHRAPMRADDTVILTLERPVETARTQPPPKPSMPPPLLGPPSGRIAAPSAGGEAALVARPGPPGGLAAPQTPPETVGAQASIDLGCFNPALKGQAKIDCDRKLRLATPLRDGPGRREEKAYAAMTPEQQLPKGPQAGWNVKPGAATVPGLTFTYVYAADDKHFLPFQGRTETRVFKKAEIYNVPTPMR